MQKIEKALWTTLFIAFAVIIGVMVLNGCGSARYVGAYSDAAYQADSRVYSEVESLTDARTKNRSAFDSSLYSRAFTAIDFASQTYAGIAKDNPDISQLALLKDAVGHFEGLDQMSASLHSLLEAKWAIHQIDSVIVATEYGKNNNK